MIHMPVLSKGFYIPPDHVHWLLFHLDRVKSELIECARDVLAKVGNQITETRMAQFVVLVLLQHVFGCFPCALHMSLRAPAFSKVREWIAGLDGSYPGESTGYKHYGDIIKHLSAVIERIAVDVQDSFQRDVGRSAREKFTKLLDARRVHIVPNADCFVGILSLNDTLRAFPAYQRGELFPYLNAWIYMHAKKITSLAEFTGLLKTPTMDGDTVYFPLASALGFYRGPTGRIEIANRLHQIEQILAGLNQDLSIVLAKAGIMEMTVISVDTTNIPVDKKDKTGSIGTGSRGTFFGHKEAASVDARCIPIAGTMHDGRKGDATTFDGVFDPANQVAIQTSQDMWAVDVDAGFSSPDVVDRIEAANAVAFVNVNPKASARLKALVTSAEALDELSSKAFNALTIKERQSWRDAVQARSIANGTPLSLLEKKRILPGLLRNLARRGMRKGLTKEEMREEGRLRKAVTHARRDILLNGTTNEKKVGLTTIPLGTLEWKLVYATRGQNEGINSIIKKRGDIIGDGQHTSWLHGAKVIGFSCNANLVGIKIVAFVAYMITGQTKHCLKWAHNWRRKRIFYVILVVMIKYRMSPIRNQEVRGKCPRARGRIESEAVRCGTS
jgi:hypothetical protein